MMVAEAPTRKAEGGTLNVQRSTLNAQVTERGRRVSDPEAQIARERRRVEARLGSQAWQRIEELEETLERLPQAMVPQHHVFTPGLYCREVLIPRGTLLTTRIHLTEHPFVISAGIVSVWDEAHGVVTLRAPHTGVTKPGTRRILFAHTDVVFSTFHLNPSNETDPDVIVRNVTFTGGKFADLRGAAKARGMPSLAKGSDE